MCITGSLSTAATSSAFQMHAVLYSPVITVAQAPFMNGACATCQLAFSRRPTNVHLQELIEFELLYHYCDLVEFPAAHAQCTRLQQLQRETRVRGSRAPCLLLDCGLRALETILDTIPHQLFKFHHSRLGPPANDLS
jgi:hypothetical protein